MSKIKVNTNHIHSLYEALVKGCTSLEDSFQSILNEGLRVFNLSLGIISQVDGERYILLGTVHNQQNGLTAQTIRTKAM